MKTGIAELPLHDGHTPKWLFEKMVKLSKSIAELIVCEYGKNNFLKRLANPFWFQAFACVLGFDFHSSGATTVTLGALKQANLKEMGIAIVGGKGKAAIRTPEEIEKLANDFSLSTKKIEKLKYASRLAAKVDNSCVQDGYQLYHHSFVVSENGKWAVIQQGMNASTKYARRYHWLSFKLKSFVNEPHLAIVGKKEKQVLDVTKKENKELRKASVDLVKENPKKLKKYFASPNSLLRYLKMQPEHVFDLKVYKKLVALHEFDPKNYEELVAFRGVGPKTIRALALISNLIYGTEISWKDPVKYSFAHGGKDRVPYPIDKRVYNESINILSDAIKQAKLGHKEKILALKRLERFFANKAII